VLAGGGAFADGEYGAAAGAGTGIVAGAEPPDETDGPLLYAGAGAAAVTGGGSRTVRVASAWGGGRYGTAGAGPVPGNEPLQPITHAAVHGASEAYRMCVKRLTR